MMQALTGHPIVDAISQIQLEGNLVPHSWYRHIRYENKRGAYSDHLACLILADIVYWYRPVAIRDEVSGEVIGWKKKFAEDKLRRSTDAFAEALGATSRQIRASMALLEELNLIEVELRSVHTGLGTIPNLMFIGLNPQAIMDISYRPKKAATLEKASKLSGGSFPQKRCALLPKSVTSNDEMGNKALRNGEQAATKSVISSDEMGNSSIYRDYSEITSEITHIEKERTQEKIEPEEKENAIQKDAPLPDAHSTSLQDSLQTSLQPDDLSLDNSSGAAATITKKSRTADPAGGDLRQERGGAFRAPTTKKFDCELLRSLYNKHKPPKWAICRHLNKNRINTLAHVYEDCGESATQMLIDALSFVASEEWWSDKILSIDNLLTKGKVIELAEKWQAKKINPPKFSKEDWVAWVSEARKRKLFEYSQSVGSDIMVHLTNGQQRLWSELRSLSWEAITVLGSAQEEYIAEEIAS